MAFKSEGDGGSATAIGENSQALGNGGGGGGLGSNGGKGGDAYAEDGGSAIGGNLPENQSYLL